VAYDRPPHRRDGQLMARTPTRPPNHRGMWRRLVARAHPDAGGDHDLFIWTMATRDVVCGGELGSEIPRRERQTSGVGERIPFDEDALLEVLTDRAVTMAEAVAEPYGYLLRQVADCHPVESGPLYEQQRRGASYKSLAAIGYQVGMSKAERVQWYGIAESIPLSQRHAGHILSKLQRAAA
jgi:hypothetical protein